MTASIPPFGSSTTTPSGRRGPLERVGYLFVPDEGSPERRFFAKPPERYAALKRELVARHGQDRLAYIAGKEAYMAGLERDALAWS